jgi:hypothetical protein
MSYRHRSISSHITLVHCPIDWPDMPQKAHLAGIFLWRFKPISGTSNR